MGMRWQCNPHVYSKMTKEGILIFHTEEGLYTRNVCVNTQFWHFSIIISWIINLIIYWGMITSRLAYILTVARFSQKSGKEQNNGRREFTSIWMLGALLLFVVYQHSPWIRKQFYKGKRVFSGIVYLDGFPS